MRLFKPALASSMVAMTTLAAVAVLPHSAGATPATRAGIGLLANRNGDAAAASSPGRYSYVVLKADEYFRIPALRAANPNVKILVYKNMAATVTYAVHNGVDDAFLPTGVGYAYSNANHPEWFLKDLSGNRIQWADYGQRWWMDIGARAYQDAWAANVKAEMVQYSFDGVMVDDTNAMRGGHLGAGLNIAQYPTDASYAAATESFLARVGPALIARGLQVVPNMAWYWSPGWKALSTRWHRYVTGSMMEFWIRTGQTSYGYPRFMDNDWDYQMDEMSVAESAGKVFLPVTYGATSDVAIQRYARASFLLGWAGGASSYIWTPDTVNTDPYTTNWTADVGTPTGARFAVGTGWRRNFTRGTVVVNPKSTGSLTVALGASFLLPSGAAVTSVTLAPGSGLILAEAGSAAQPPSPSTPPPASPAPSPPAGQAPVPVPTPTPIVSPTPTPSPVPVPKRRVPPVPKKKPRVVRVKLVPAVRWIRH